MPDPLDYREPATGDAPKRQSPPRSAFAVGGVVLVISAAVMFLPVAIPLGQLAKYVATAAFIGACIGLSIITNAAIDRWRRP
jgi:hypothetical protein